VEVLSRSSSSPLGDLYGTSAFRKEWENDIRFHTARNLVYLRRYRGTSQKALAELVGTSQPAIARIESGQENITLDTLKRIAHALDGRIFVSIHPADHEFHAPRSWWEELDLPVNSWKVVGWLSENDGHTERALIGIERPAATTDTTPLEIEPADSNTGSGY
jgi:transcriptional regulator with XRE-family HTH domain